jgi:hypothetical protein
MVFPLLGPHSGKVVTGFPQKMRATEDAGARFLKHMQFLPVSPAARQSGAPQGAPHGCRMIPKKLAAAKARVADFSDKIMRKLNA